MEAEKGLVEDCAAADALFHRSNEFLTAMEGVIFSTLPSSIRLSKAPRENEDSIPVHREVHEAIVRRDAAGPERMMAKLLGDARTQEVEQLVAVMRFSQVFLCFSRGQDLCAHLATS